MKTILSLLIIITGFMPAQVSAAASGGGAGGAAAVHGDRFDVDAALLADPSRQRPLLPFERAMLDPAVSSLVGEALDGRDLDRVSEMGPMGYAGAERASEALHLQDSRVVNVDNREGQENALSLLARGAKVILSGNVATITAVLRQPRLAGVVINLAGVEINDRIDRINTLMDRLITDPRVNLFAITYLKLGWRWLPSSEEVTLDRVKVLMENLSIFTNLRSLKVRWNTIDESSNALANITILVGALKRLIYLQSLSVRGNGLGFFDSKSITVFFKVLPATLESLSVNLIDSGPEERAAKVKALADELPRLTNLRYLDVSGIPAGNLTLPDHVGVEY